MAIKKVPASMVAKETAKMKQMPKKLTKPTEEYSKSSSELANWLVKKYNLTPAEARTAAGKYRDMLKAMPPDRVKSLDATGAAMGKAIKQVKSKPTIVKPGVKTRLTPKDAAKALNKKSTKRK